MSPRTTKPKPVLKPILKHPWPIVTGTLIGLLLVLTLFFLFYGISPEIDGHMVGNVGISLETNSAGQEVLYPMPGFDAAKAGVENFDILLDINGQPVSKTTEIQKQLNGRVGQPLTITVRKKDGSEKTYSLVRSSAAQAVLNQAGLSVGFLTGYLTSSVPAGWVGIRRTWSNSATAPACPCDVHNDRMRASTFTIQLEQS